MAFGLPCLPLPSPVEIPAKIPPVEGHRVECRPDLKALHPSGCPHPDCMEACQCVAWFGHSLIGFLVLEYGIRKDVFKGGLDVSVNDARNLVGVLNDSRFMGDSPSVDASLHIGELTCVSF